ncbi:hypothetical protein HLB25_02250 [Dickeya dadantii]|uniref:restriction endonuclease subunit S n=1 Tax=Dickeya dadantii TaxID=204038 RepID=UPI001495C1AE|nr:restriction endonuclease subunit S [Dickeya dadantii]NPE55668.1 hypothetical protein [Dickeya dadantii]NPE65695.1 hypothetical protein [Dickeya dadantii]
MSEVKLPQGWVSCKFTDILDIQGGTQPPKSEFISSYQDGYIRLLQIRDFGKKPVPTYIPDTKKIKKCEKSDLLIGRYGASLGRICSGMDGAYNVALAKVISSPKIKKAFLKKYLESEIFQSPLRLLSRSAQNGFNKEDLSTFNFLLIPEKEQVILAEKLDTLLAQVDSIKAHLEQIPLIIKKFRQSVLAAAVSGELTKGWRYENKKNAEPWNEKKIQDIVSHIEAGKNIKCIERPPYDGEFGVVKISAVTWGEYNEEESKTLFDKNQFIENRKINAGDFLISRANTLELLGAPVIVYKTTKSLMLSDKVLRLVMDDFQKPWVSIFLRSQMGRKEIESRSTGSQLSMRNIGQKALLDIVIPTPPLEEQAEIVRRVEQLFAYADGVEKQVQSALERVNNLTQSILAKAFRGELTAQWREENPELISGENSAEALLACIKAERAAQQPQKKTRQKANAAG